MPTDTDLALMHLEQESAPGTDRAKEVYAAADQVVSVLRQAGRAYAKMTPRPQMEHHQDEVVFTSIDPCPAFP